MTLNSNSNNGSIHSEQVNLLYKSLKASAIGTLLAAIIFVFISQQYSTPTIYLYIWLGAISILSIIRLVLYFFYTKSSRVNNNEYWDKLFFYGVVSSGILWSVVGVFSIDSKNEVYLTLIFLMLMGVNSVAVTTLAYIKKYMYMFYILSVSPFLFIQVSSGSFFSYIMFAFLMLFTVLIFTNTKRLYDFFEKNFYLQRELELKNNQLNNANKAKSDFLSNMSHELRTPLNAVNGFSQLLLMNDDNNLNQEQIENIELILTAGNHLLSLISGVLDHAKIESGNIEANLEPTIPADIISGCVSMVEHLAVQRGVHIDNQTAELATTIVNADQKKLKQIFINLLSNAIKYNNENGRITIQAKISDANELEIGIIDTGNGLSEEQQQKLFQPFERISNDVENIEGTGLGLVICKQLINLMHGDIYVLSIPGEGSQFWIRLPIS